MKKSRVLALGLTAALSVSLLAGCGTGDTQTTPAPEGSTPVETGTTGATNELNVCFASEPETMDPSMNRTVDGNVMITHLFEGLYKWVDSDPSGDGRNGATAVLEPGMAAEVLVSKRPDLFVNGVVVTADAFGFPHGLQRCQNLADFTAQPPGVVSNARKCQLCFADVH